MIKKDSMQVMGIDDEERLQAIDAFVKRNWPASVPEECMFLDGDIDCADRAHLHGSTGRYLTAIATITVDQMCEPCKVADRLYTQAEAMFGERKLQ